MKKGNVKIPNRLQPHGFNKDKLHKLHKRTTIIGVCNIQGLRKKVVYVINEFESRNLDIVVLSETKKKGNGVETNAPYIHLYSGGSVSYTHLVLCSLKKLLDLVTMAIQ